MNIEQMAVRWLFSRAPVRKLAEQHLEDGGDWLDVVRIAAIVSDDRAWWMWEMAREAFAELDGTLGDYSKTLGPENWSEAFDSAYAAVNMGSAAYSAPAIASGAAAYAAAATIIYAGDHLYAAAAATAFADMVIHVKRPIIHTLACAVIEQAREAQQ